MALPNKKHRPPEIWLKEEASSQLEKIIDALNAAYTMPFECIWLEEELGQNYLEILKEMESLLLLIWGQSKEGNITKIEHAVLVWHGRQQRSSKNILRRYYRLHEQLAEWGSSPEAKSFGLLGTWKDYLFFVMTLEPNFLKKVSSTKESSSSAELEKFAIHYLQKIQMLHRASPHALCADFFTWLSPFTQESVFLPVLATKDVLETKSATFESFRSQLLQSQEWGKLSGLYLKLLVELAGKKAKS